MLVVDAQAVGEVALHRMVRDRVVTAATDRFALPADVELTRGVRAWCVAPSVPGHTVVSGLAGLWVWHGGFWPGSVCVVGRRGLHRVVAPAAQATAALIRDPVVFHSGLAWSSPAASIGNLRVASPARCCVDALRWEDHRLAIPAVSAAVTSGIVPLADLVAEQRIDNPRGSGYARLHQVWQELAPVLSGVKHPV